MKKNQPNELLEQQLNNLPEIANSALADLTAGAELNHRIQMAVMEARTPKKKAFSMRRVLSVATACAAAAALVVCLTPVVKQVKQARLIHSSSLGDDAPAVTEDLLLADLNGDDVAISEQKAVPSYRNLWSASTDGFFPLIGVNGRYYRMMTSPRSVSSSLLGSSVGTIAEFTATPSLSGTDVVLSNKAAFGTEVYEISGMGGTLVVAEVDGTTRLFQRVSFNGNALKGSESLADTLQISGHVSAMELSDVGTISDASVCEQLLSTLLNNATYESSGSLNASQSLLIELDNGLVVQMAVKNDKLAACGVWSCPEFIEAFESACNN